MRAIVPPTKTPLPAVIVPLLLMPPDTMASLVTKMPFPSVDAVMCPALMTAPPTEALLMVMPVRLGWLTPAAVSVPVMVLVTSPVTVMPLMLMQLTAAELLTED